MSSLHDEMVRAALRHAQRGRNDRALNELEKVVRAAPDHAGAQRELGSLLHRLGRADEAMSRLMRAVEIAPADAVANRALAKIARSAGQLEVAADAWLRVPRDAQTLDELAVVRQEQGRIDEAADGFRQALSLDPSFAAAHSNLLLCLNYHESCSDEQLFAEHEAFGGNFGGGDAAGFATPQAAEGPIRIGYLSPDFFSHSVSFFIMPVLGCHDRTRFSVTCYSDVRRPDEVTALLRARADAWRETTQLSDEQLAQQILADRIDILVDLAGHTLHNRLPLLATRRLAPVQVTYLGYPNTTGLRTIDYRITDGTADPLGVSDALHTERLVRLSRGSFFTSIDLVDAPDALPLPSEKRGGQVTFAVATNWSKVRPPMLRLYARVVAAVANARLLLQSRSLADPPTRETTLGILRDAGLSDDRIELRTWAGFPQYAAMLAHEADIVLDTFPFNGHTTTWQALWMGAPVVTLAGRAAHRSRMGASILKNVGLGELTAYDHDDFVRIACALANDPRRLQELRVGLRERMRQSVLLDAAGFTKDLEAAYAEMVGSLPAVTP